MILADLNDQEDSNPLIVSVVQGVAVMLPLSTAALEIRRDVEGGVHPAVAVQHTAVHPTSTLESFIFMRIHLFFYSQCHTGWGCRRTVCWWR